MIVDTHIPQSIRTCLGAPAVPGEGTTQRDVSRYITRLHRAHGDCKIKLAAVDDILRQQEEEATKPLDGKTAPK